MRLEEITPTNKTFLDLIGKEKLAIGSAYFGMLNLFDACKASTVPKSTWTTNFEKFNASVAGALEMLDRMPDQKDSFVLTLKSVLNSYQNEINNLNEQI